MVREELDLVLNLPADEIEDDIRREAQLLSRLESEPGYN